MSLHVKSEVIHEADAYEDNFQQFNQGLNSTEHEDDEEAELLNSLNDSNYFLPNNADFEDEIIQEENLHVKKRRRCSNFKMKPIPGSSNSYFYHHNGLNSDEHNSSDYEQTNRLISSQTELKLPMKLPLIIEYFYIVNSTSVNGESIKGKCKYCSYEFNCKMKPTSNFSKHAQSHDKLFIEYLKAKESQSKRRVQGCLSNKVDKQPQAACVLMSEGNENIVQKILMPERVQAQAQIEREITRFFVNSLLNMNIVEASYFKEFVRGLVGTCSDNFKNLTQTKLVNQLIPTYYEEIDSKMRELISNQSDGSYYSIHIDIFSDLSSPSKSCLFVGFSLSSIMSNWQLMQQAIGCLIIKIDKLIKYEHAADMLNQKLIELCQKYQLPMSHIYKILFDPELKELNLWKQYQRWSLPSMETLDENFFELDIDTEQSDLIDEDTTELPVDLDMNDLNENVSTLACNLSNNSHSTKMYELLFGRPIGTDIENLPCVIDTLNSFVKELMNQVFTVENELFIFSQSCQSNLHKLTVLLKLISKSIYLATFKQQRSKMVIAAICKIKKAYKDLPKWTQQLILLKKVFKVDVKSFLSTIRGLCSLTDFDKALIKEFIDLMDPLLQMLIELSNQSENESTNKFSRVLPCLKTTMAIYKRLNPSLLNDVKILIEQNLHKRFGFVLSNSVFRLAAMLDPRFGTSWVPGFEKKQLEHLLIEHVTLNEASSIYNMQLNKAHFTLNPANCKFSNPGSDLYRYVNYDETCLNSDKNKDQIYHEEVVSYLKFIRCDETKALSYEDLEPLQFWSTHCDRWPCLARLVKKVFTIQPHPQGIEKKLGLDTHQSIFNFKNMEQIIFLKCNQNLS